MQLEKVKTTLLNYCKEQGVESVRTSEGIFYRSVKTRYWTSDWEAMHDFVKTHDALELLEKRISQSALQEFLEDNPDLPQPEGLKAKSEYTLSVRKKMTTQFRPIEDVAKKLSVSTSTVRAWTRQGHIPDNAYIKIGQTYRYLVDETIAGLIKHNAEPDEVAVTEPAEDQQ